MSEPVVAIKIDLQHPRRSFEAGISAGDTPIIRSFLYLNGKQFVPDSSWTAKIGLGTDFSDSTELILVDGESGVNQGATSDANYFDFEFTAQDCATAGDYFAQILIQNADATQQYVFGRGTVHILPSPISGEYTEAVFTSIVNWDLISANTGTVPWVDTTEVVEIDCADSPIELQDLPLYSGVTFIVPATCSQDVTLMLPDATSLRVGSVYKFINQSSQILYVRSQSTDHIDELIDGNAIYSGQNGTNINPPYASIRIKQLKTNEYHCEFGRNTWTYTN